MKSKSVATKSITKTWTREQYDLMQEHAHELGYHLITPYRKNLVNIRVGVIRQLNDLPSSDSKANSGHSDAPSPPLGNK